MKRLRAHLSEREGSATIRYFACGEYGTKLGRPHYHVALFGEDFTSDRYIWRNKGFPLHRSPTLEQLWPHGNCEIGDLTIDSAMYIASYVTKKVTGPKAHEHYERIDPITLDVIHLEPEFSLMSRGGRNGRGLAWQWFEKYHTDVYPHDHVVNHKGFEMKPPRYYDKLIEAKLPTTAALIKFRREMRGKLLAGDNTPARLAAKETVTIARMQTKKRSLET